MLQIFMTNDLPTGTEFLQIENIQKGAWINLVQPTPEEITFLKMALDVPEDFILAALDEEERSRIETDEDYTLIIIDIPVASSEEYAGLYITVPMSIIVSDHNIITICMKEHAILDDFINRRVKGFFTYKKTRFIFQILYKNAAFYLQYLRQIDRRSNQVEMELHRSLKNKELIQLLGLEKSLVYFSTSLKSNEVVLEKMMRFNPVKMYPEDQEILEDVIIENKQAIEMSGIYSNILSGTMDAFASVISNNLNIVMKILASITIVLSIPTIVASFFGMNVAVPLADEPHAFLWIFLISSVIAGVLGLVMLKKNLF
ncbi:magnesium transporter CorA family protein [Anaerotalea alkaliphila]|uniref:Magnesium transporter CorA family protein n=1 Tax=Anaerotalea alkaliphila TaxID=2662126 RepID=A0A7X5HTI4_9FIRM|nr:magnesium transporter CorA family protein [Anaerotalea alkaliphila]NDL66373.1 magnesium transporter CorA family protein [Anaerotalea alkaliphila]